MRCRRHLIEPCKNSIWQQEVASQRKTEKTKRELSLLAIDCLSLILLASCYPDWNIILWIPLLEYPTHDTVVRSAPQPECRRSTSRHWIKMKKAAPLTSGQVAQMRNQDRSSLAEFKRIKSLQVKVFFSQWSTSPGTDNFLAQSFSYSQ